MSDPVIFYFEDDALSREVMRACLTRGMGYHNVWIFEDSIDFESQLNGVELKPDVVFLDIHIEPVDGFAMLERIRQSETYRSTKVIALTASVMNEEVKMLKDAGFDGVIAKPLDYDTFPGALERILKGEQVWHIR
ncbi:MAG: response regulator [Anaerolineae bacterium]|nr:response regulator [Anaerolineae bacterium]